MLAGSVASAAERKARATGFFSDMHWVEEAGDVVGMEVLISYVPGGTDGQYWVYVQIAEGVPSPPVIVEASVKGSQIEFTLPESTGLGKFVGKATEKALIGKFEKSTETVRLPRHRSYWQ